MLKLNKGMLSRNEGSKNHECHQYKQCIGSYVQMNIAGRQIEKHRQFINNPICGIYTHKLGISDLLALLLRADINVYEKSDLLPPPHLREIFKLTIRM